MAARKRKAAWASASHVFVTGEYDHGGDGGGGGDCDGVVDGG